MVNVSGLPGHDCATGSTRASVADEDRRPNTLPRLSVVVGLLSRDPAPQSRRSPTWYEVWHTLTLDGIGERYGGDGEGCAVYVLTPNDSHLVDIAVKEVSRVTLPDTAGGGAAQVVRICLRIQ